MKKGLIFGLSAVVTTVGLTTVLSKQKNNLFNNAGDFNYTLNVNKAISSSELAIGSASFITGNGNAIDFNFDSSKVETASGAVIKLNTGATFANTTAISGITEIDVVASYGSFTITSGIASDKLVETSELLDTQEQENVTFNVVLTKNANYFAITNVASSTTIKSLSIKYTCTQAIDETPILKTAVFADVQLCNDKVVKEGGTVVANENLGTVANAALALRDHLRLCKENNVDVIFMNGDISNNAITYYYEHYQSIFESVYGTDPSKYPEIIWNMGNHEWWDINEHDTACAVSLFNQYANIDSPYLVARSSVKYSLDSSVTIPTYYKVVKGIPFLVISGENSAGLVSTTLQNEIQGWLEDISNLDSVKAGGPIYVCYHCPLSSTFTFGEGSTSKADAVTNLLKNYPQAVVFTGDTHYPGVNERAINQVDFTTINIGSSSYSRTITRSATMGSDESFYNLEHTTAGSAKDVLTGEAKFKQEYTPTIHMMDTLSNFSTNINRYFSAENPANAKHVGKTWTIPNNVTKSTFKYTNARFQNTNAANDLYGANGVSFDETAKVEYEVKDGVMTVKFPDPIQYPYVEYFKITVKGDSNKVYNVVSNYYKCLDDQSHYYYTLSDLPSGDNYEVTVQAYDYFDNPSLNTLRTSEPSEGCAVWGVDYGMNMSYTDISTRINVFDTYDGGSSSYEAYYKGLATYNAGATVGYVIRKDKANAGADNYVSLNNASDAIPTLQFKAKALTSDDIKVGVTVVDGNGTWKTDFGGEYQKTLTADGEWHDFSWNLASLFNITSKTNIKYLQIKMKSTNPDAINGYEMNAIFAGIDLVNGNGDQPEPQERGDAFKANTDFSKTIAHKALNETVTIDIKFNSGNELNIMLGQEWSKYYGYYKVKANGTFNGTYAGASISALDDGYYRLVFDLSKLNKIDGGTAPDEYVNLIYIRGAWSDVDGRIDIEPSSGGNVIRGRSFTAGSDFDADFNPTVAISGSISLDFKFTTGSDTRVCMMLGQGWNQYWGMYSIYGDGKLGEQYQGVSVSFLDDGYFRVTFDLTKLNKLSDKPAPDSYVNLLYFRGTWTTGSGYVDIVK